jgi:hypothetical protein
MSHFIDSNTSDLIQRYLVTYVSRDGGSESKSGVKFR